MGGALLAVVGLAYVYRDQLFLIAGLGVIVIALVRVAGAGDSQAPTDFTGDVLVWRDRTLDGYQDDAARLAQRGFIVTSVVDQQQRSGCLRILTINFLALLWKPPSKILVTYQRARR